MINSIKKTVLILAIYALISQLTGCFDRRELNTLGYVLGVAVDRGENADETKLTLQIAKVKESDKSKSSPTSKGGGSGGETYINITDDGTNINQIIRDMEYKVSRRLYVPHNQIIVFGEELARRGVRDSLDFLARAPEARTTVYTLVAKGKAYEILEADTVFEKTPSSDIKRMIDDQVITSTIPRTTELDLISDMISRSKAPVAPLIEIVEEEGAKRVKCAGTAVFKRDKMIGQMDMRQTRGMLYILDKVRTGIMLVKVKDIQTTVEIRSTKSKVKYELKKDGGILVDIEVKQTVGIGDQSGGQNVTDTKNMPELLKNTEKTVREEIMMAVEKAKELDADVFGFGKGIYRKYPKKWKKLEENWDENFKKIETVVRVKVKADGSGRIMHPIAPVVP